MANPEHLQILRQGVEAWNAWRDAYQLLTPDLRDATLRGAVLGGADLHGATLSGADLTRADLTKATLVEADLTRADLHGATLVEADLTRATLGGADLHGATLRDATLTRADLTRATLRDATLTRADLTRATLRDATLTRADLTRATLVEADLRGATLARATLARADLRDAILSRADLRDADLRDATLTRADLFEADLTRATLHGADLSEITLYETIFSNINLTTARGLETCRHVGPSTLDHRTLAQSGPLPPAFLRGCGLPDTLIDYLPALLNAPFQFYSCFISYASTDQTFTKRLHADLQNKGVRCWFAPKDLPIGAQIRVSLDETIRVYDKLLLVLSKASVTSQWVEQEVETALAREREQKTTILFPVRIDNTVMTIKTGWPALIRNARNIGDFRRWKTHDVYQTALARLLRDLTAPAVPRLD